MSNVANIYNCGGAGLNIGNHFVKYNNKKDPGFAEIKTFFIDTSKSNIAPSIPAEQVYLVDGLDGSGKKRDTNYTALSECSKEILHQFKPADVNIVIHSTSGGSGSVLGPILVSELLSREALTIVILIGGTSSKIETENTLKTLKSYEMISHKRKMPVVAAYKENSALKPRGVVDAEIQTTIVILAAIFSGNNKELDASDLKNFINYNNVTSFTPKLALLDFFSKDIVLGKGQSLASLVTLVDEKTSSDVPMPVEYQAVGFLPEVTKEAVSVELPIHACVITGYFNAVADGLDAKLAEYDEARKVVVEKSIVKMDADHTEEGLIL